MVHDLSLPQSTQTKGSGHNGHREATRIRVILGHGGESCHVECHGSTAKGCVADHEDPWRPSTFVSEACDEIGRQEDCCSVDATYPRSPVVARESHKRDGEVETELTGDADRVDLQRGILEVTL